MSYQNSVYKGCLRCGNYVSSYGCMCKYNPKACQFYDKDADKKEGDS